MKNWKTSWAGILHLVPSALHLFLPQYVSATMVLELNSLLTFLGFVSAKDNNVTGGTVQQ